MCRTLAKLTLLAFLTLVCTLTMAATLNVNNQASGCDDITGKPYCQIQPAIDAALPGDSINVASGSYFSSDLSAAVVVIPTGKNITLTGAGADNTHLIGDEQGRRGVIVQAGAVASISGLSITGAVLNLDDNAHGAGIQNLGTLTLSNCLIEGNTTAGNGGGIYSESILTINNCVISGNSANRTDAVNENSGGGGIYATGQLELRDSVLYDNQAVYAGGGLMLDNLTTIGHANIIDSRILKNSAKTGAGIHSKIDLTLMHSRILINQATSSGGGLALETQITANIVNSLIYFNQAYGNGGGIFQANASEVNIYSTSIVNNRTLRGSGGGIFTDSKSGTVTISNSLLSGNEDRGVSATNPDSPDCAGSLQSRGYNLITNNRNCHLAVSFGDIQNIDAKLKIDSIDGNAQQLINVTLDKNSPAIDKGNPNGCQNHQSMTIALDLVANDRTQDSDTDGAPRCDIGAFETPAPIVAPVIEDTPTPTPVTSIPSNKSGGGTWGYFGLILLLCRSFGQSVLRTLIR